MKNISLFVTALFLNIAFVFSMPKDAIRVWHKPLQDSLINGNPVEQQHVVADTVEIESENFCIFSVHDARNGEKEKSIWRMTKKSGKEVICTTDRVADLDDITYMNYCRKKTYPRIYSYKYKMPKDSSKRIKNIIVGGRTKEYIPIDTALGMQGEYIVTNRILNPKEMGVVESYLSIKYGISLDKTKSYYSASGKEIWNSKRNSSYNENVFGVGRDSLSGLSQEKSENVAEPSLVVSSKEIREGEYILFGDNGGNLDYEKNEGFAILQREWKVNHIGSDDSLYCDLEFSVKPQYKSILWLRHADDTEEFVEPDERQIFQRVALRDGDKFTLVTKDDIDAETGFIIVSANPNPVQMGENIIVTIRTESSTKYELRMYDDEGRTILSQDGFTDGMEQISVPMNISGVVIVEAEARGVKSQTKVIVKQ